MTSHEFSIYGYDNVHGADIVTVGTAIARVHQVHLMSAEWRRAVVILFEDTSQKYFRFG